MTCKKCGNILTGKQTSYCSVHCSKLHLKSLWRKRNKERLNKYNRERNKKTERPLDSNEREEVYKRRGTKCERCGIFENPNIHHIKPLILGGEHNDYNLMILCQKCHMMWHQKLVDFWIE